MKLSALLSFVLIAVAAGAQDPGTDDAPLFDPDTYPGLAEDQLYALGYLPGELAPEQRAGVTEYDEARAQPGLNLVISPHTTGAYLMDMRGKILHTWHHDLWNSPESAAIPPEIRKYQGRTLDYWSRVHLFENGDLLFIHKGCGLFRMNKDSQIQWAAWIRAHHDLELLEDGRLYTLANSEPDEATWPDMNGCKDFLVELEADGREIRRVCIDDALAASNFAQLREGREEIYLHSNEIVVLDGRWEPKHPAFRKGNVLISCRDIDAFLVLDVEAAEIVWGLTGIWRRQHGPVLLDNGRMLVFDNRGNDGHSRVLEVDPFSGAAETRYEGQPKRAFSSAVGGYLHPLPNGNLLITESTQGVAFEVTPGRDRVWEYFNPARLKDHDGRISPLFSVQRLLSTPEFLRATID